MEKKFSSIQAINEKSLSEESDDHFYCTNIVSNKQESRNCWCLISAQQYNLMADPWTGKVTDRPLDKHTLLSVVSNNLKLGHQDVATLWATAQKNLCATPVVCILEIL